MQLEKAIDATRAAADAKGKEALRFRKPRKADGAAVWALIQRIDQDESKAVSQMRIFPLRNAVAEE